jgi:hypothetical protein
MQAPLSPGAHNVIVPPADASDLSVQAELDDAFEQLAGDRGEPIDALPPLEYAPQLSAQGGSFPREPEGLHDGGIFTPSHEEPLGELLEQLTAARAEVAEEVRAAAAAEGRPASGASDGDAGMDEDASFPPAELMAEDEDGPLSLVVPRPGSSLRDPALLSEESSLSPAEIGDWGQPTSADERLGLDLGATEPDRTGRESAPVRPAMPIPQDEDVFLAEEPTPDGSGRTPLPVRVLEWVNKPLAGLPEAVRQAMGKVAILTLINAVLVLVYVLLVRGR